MSRHPEQIIRRGETFTGRKLLEAFDAVNRKAIGGRGVEITTGGGADGGAYISETGRKPQRRVSYPVQLAGNVVMTPNVWAYAWSEVVRNTEWEIRAKGRTNLNRGMAMNLAEYGNTGEGIEMNGIDVDELPDGFFIAPLPAGRVLLLTEVTVAAGDAKEFWLDMNNAVQGQCQ